MEAEILTSDVKLHILSRERPKPRAPQVARKTATPVRIPKAFLKTWVKKSIRELKIQGKKHPRLQKLLNKGYLSKDLVLVFVSGPQMKKLNSQFRGKNKVTDVLSFESGDPEVLGELVLCAPVLKAQALEHKLTFQEELGYMVLHGLLHLLGYDHEKSEREAKVMFEIQDSAFEKLLVKKRPL